VTDLLFLMLLGHPKVQGLSAQKPVTQRGIVDLAKELAEAAPESELGVLTWIVAAIYAHGCGGLSPEQRSAALAFVRTRTADDDPIARLAPAIFYRLGETGEAANRRTCTSDDLPEPDGPIK
jgi:hypothetical protein